MWQRAQLRRRDSCFREPGNERPHDLHGEEKRSVRGAQRAALRRRGDAQDARVRDALRDRAYGQAVLGRPGIAGHTHTPIHGATGFPEVAAAARLDSPTGTGPVRVDGPIAAHPRSTAGRAASLSARAPPRAARRPRDTRDSLGGGAQRRRVRHTANQSEGGPTYRGRDSTPKGSAGGTGLTLVVTCTGGDDRRDGRRYQAAPSAGVMLVWCSCGKTSQMRGA